jgi:hypothetical protein
VTTPPSDGSSVSYIGMGPDFGHQASLLTTRGHAAHVKWASGPHAGAVTMVDTDDLVPTNQRAARVERDELADSLDVGTIAATGVRAVQDAEGTVGVLGMLVRGGHLGDLQEIVDDAMATVVAHLRRNAGLREVVSQLDDDEGEDLVQTTAHVLLRDAFGSRDD